MIGKPKLIIGLGSPEGHECNVIHLSDDAYPNAQDGEQVTTQVSGKLVIKDGAKTLVVTEADGKPVKGESEPSEESDDSGVEESRENLSQGIKKMYGESEEE